MPLCPSCGRPADAGNTCPHCGASLTLRLPLKILRYASLVLAVSGFIALLYMVQGAPVPQLKVSTISAVNNLAYVALAGRVTQAHYNAEQQSLSFQVLDDTGEIAVTAFRAEAEALIAAGRVPAVGDAVTVAGTLRVRDDFLGLTLNTVEALSLTSPTPTPLLINAITPDLELHAIEITARFIESREPFPGLVLLTLQDATGVIEVAFDESARLLTGDLPLLPPESVVRVRGIVTLFKERPQVTLTSNRHLELLPPDTVLELATEPTTLTPLAAAQLGAVAKVAGEITAVESFSTGFRFTLSDDTGSIALVVPLKMYPEISGTADLRLGAQVEAYGLVSLFNGEREIAPPAATAVILRQPSALTRTVTSIAELTLSHLRQTVTLSGTITAIDSFSSGKRLTLDDGTGSITVLIWSNVLAYVPDAARLTREQTVTLTGRVEHYRGQLELVPQLGFDVTVH